MKKIILTLLLALAALAAPFQADAQFKLGKALDAAKKGVQAVTLTDDQMAAYVKESIDWMDTHNKVSDADSEYTKRLNRLTEGLTEVDGIPLNFKVYEVIDVNAFACPDGSVRVFSSLMEVGHVAKRHSKKAFKQELLTGAAMDAIASSGNTAAALTQSQLGSLGASLMGAKFSQKQEKEADDYGYDFLKSHGKNPWGMVMSFEKFLTLEGDSAQKTSYFNKMFSSHPDTKDRIKRLSERAKKDGIARPEETRQNNAD